MTYSRLRDILNMLSSEELSQDAMFLIKGKLVHIDFVDSFRNDIEFAKKYNSNPSQIFFTNNKEL